MNTSRSPSAIALSRARRSAGPRCSDDFPAFQPAAPRAATELRRLRIIKSITNRTILRWIHILFGLPLLGYIYGPPEAVQQYTPLFRYVFVPVLLLSGLLMWKGHLLGRIFGKKSG